MQISFLRAQFGKKRRDEGPERVLVRSWGNSTVLVNLPAEKYTYEWLQLQSLLMLLSQDEHIQKKSN